MSDHGVLIAAIIRHEYGSSREVYEPFCRSLNVTRFLKPDFASDISGPLINTLFAISCGYTDDSHGPCYRMHTEELAIYRSLDPSAVTAALAACPETKIYSCNYRDWARNGVLFYCDPPRGWGDHEWGLFWKWARRQHVRSGSIVVTSAQVAPNDFKIIGTYTIKKTKPGPGKARVEHLWVHDA